MSRAPAAGLRVRRAVAGDEAVLRALRLAALADAPDAFESTLERERARPAADWSRWLTDAATFLLERSAPRPGSGAGGDVGAEAVGMAAGVPHRDDPDAVFLMSMWVRPDARGTGGADALVAAVVHWAEERGARAVLLDVGEHNARARRLYERSGFTPTGRTSSRDVDGLPELEMHRVLRREPEDGEP